MKNLFLSLLSLSLVSIPFEALADRHIGDPGASRGCDEPASFAGLPRMSIIEPDNSTNRLTIATLPTFLVYVPFELSNEHPGRFLVEAEDGTLIYETILRNSSGNEIIPIQLPSSNANLLEAGQTYSLSFRVYCDDSTMSNSTSFTSYAEVTKVASNTPGVYGYDELQDAYNSGSLSNSNWQEFIENSGL